MFNSTNGNQNNSYRDYMISKKLVRIGIMMLFIVSLTSWSASAQHQATIIGADGFEVSSTHGGSIHPDDSTALLAYYESMQGQHWIEQGGWLTTDPVDTWAGINRVENVGTDDDPEWRVTRMVTPRFNMTVPGHFPEELGLMKYLHRFRVQMDLVTGEIPPEVGDMDRLDDWHCIFNYLTGEVPWEQLRGLNLERFMSAFNLYYGELPDNIGDFPSLVRLDIRDNHFTGTIPASLADLDFHHLRLGHNLIGGDLPDMGHMENLSRFQVMNLPLDPGPVWPWLDDLESLDELYIEYTNRTGEFPQWLTQKPNLRDLSLGEHYRDHPENALGGPIPNLEQLVDLQRLYIYGPHWTGEIPEWLGFLNNIDWVYFHDTELTGSIPGTLADANLTQIDFRRNHKLTGGLPADFQDLGSIQFLVLQDNSSLDIGDLPSWLGDLTSIGWLDLSGSGVTGALPDLSNLSNLRELYLRDNPGLTGEIPEYLQERTYNAFDVSRTGLDITEFPSWLNTHGSRQNLNTLGLAGFGIEGEIPSWLGEMVWLEKLALDDNNFSGSIPAELGNLPVLDSLNLANNQLSGEIPQNLVNAGRLGGDIVVLESFIVSGNEDLEGEIPFGFTDASWMRHFRYDGTGLYSPNSEFDDWLDQVVDNANLTFPASYSSVMKSDAGPPVSAETGSRPYSFRLNQNYPNPFNPTTVIQYEIPVDANVTLNVYNVLGQQVVTLVNENLSAGQYEVNFDATGLASGSYIYRLKAGDRVQTQTMMLIK